MKGDVRNTLTLPFERELLDLPVIQSEGVFFNARPLQSSDIDWPKLLTCEQGHRGDYLSLERVGYQVSAMVNSGGFACALVLCGKHKRLNEANLARACAATSEGDVIVVAGDKTAGIAPLRKYASKFANIEGHLSKHHAVVFWFRNPGNCALQDTLSHNGPDGFKIAPGMFSSDGIDVGSALLASHLDKRIGGNVADFGAGWGYLSRAVLEQCGTLHHLDLYEVDWASLEAAKHNIASDNVRLGFHWHDLLGEPVSRTYDWIIMNPPFHSDRPAEPAIGQAFIRIASKSLRKGGRLLMVANRNLPYEKELAAGFRSHQRLDEAQGFKIVEAIR